jgi:hypothetical protein
MSKILMHSLMPNSLGEALTLKIINQIKILTAPASRSNPSLNSDGASASLLDSQQISAQAPTARPSAPFSESPPINPVVTADLVFVSEGVAKPNAQPSNPQQISAQASTIGPSPHVAKSKQRGEPVVTAQLVLVPVPVAHENSSNSPRGAEPGSVQREIARINSLNEGPKSKQRAEPVVTAQLVLVPVPHEDQSNSPMGERPGSVQREIARINSLNEGPKSKSR